MGDLSLEFWLASTAVVCLLAALGGVAHRLAIGVPAFCDCECNQVTGPAYTAKPKDVDLSLFEGERYAGLLLDSAGNPDYHLVLLPGIKRRIRWHGALEWSIETGGALPSLRDAYLLTSNLRDEFGSAPYLCDHNGKAWSFNFQNATHQRTSMETELSARAVRRININPNQSASNTSPRSDDVDPLIE